MREWRFRPQYRKANGAAGKDGKFVDQVAELIHQLKKQPDSRRMDNKRMELG